MMAVLLVDDHAMFREALVMALGHAVPGLAIHSAASGQEALEVLEQHASIQHVIMDFYLPDMAGADLLKRLRQRRARLRILVLSASQDPEDMRQALEAGAQGFLNKSASCQELAAALNAVNEASAPSSCGMSASATSAGGQDDAALLRALTPRQHEVLRLMCEGLRNKEISERLSMTEKTVKTHVSAVLGTLGVLNRTQATLVARRAGVVGKMD
ncbi:Transcriptional regulatory protein devR (dosR) [Achromobacter insolitus]|uniref:response regulator transcription factor n=1 Tax=Achromobacter insolitus TaxID=217204 RepID=UPI0009FF36BE|nr:response regulator transcription factor [Achromobacter insolitus]OWT62740.1 DNA-binding response regulator [Achromobacter insolitus]CAB3656723.1 Transcriptional activator protein ExaE [Achromobacter insolitus]VEG65873.1 Transcriptional regulatory protein devR (dosR) [Achromobacter insolitus]